ncbi:MAG: glycosyltransferase [Ilumatobacteraceae bacterium]
MTGERRYALDGSVQSWPNDDGCVVIGGSPLTLFRLTSAGARTFGDLADGRAVGNSPLVDRLLDAGAIHPLLDGTGTYSPADVTIVVPTLGPPAHAPTGAVIVDDGSLPPVEGATIRLDRNRGPAAARNAGLATVTTPLVAFVDADVAVPDGWLDPLLPHFDDPKVAVVAPRIVTAGRPGAISAYERTHGPLDMGPEAAASGPAPASRTSPPPYWSAVPRRFGPSVGSTRRCGSARTSISSGGSTTPADDAGTTRVR